MIRRYPLALGDGSPLYGRTPYRPRRFDLVASRRFESGASVQEYVPATGADHG